MKSKNAEVYNKMIGAVSELLGRKTNDEALNIMINRSFMLHLLEREVSGRLEQLSCLPTKKLKADVNDAMGMLAMIEQRIRTMYQPSMDASIQSHIEHIIDSGENNLVRDDQNFQMIWVASLEAISSTCSAILKTDSMISKTGVEFEPTGVLLARIFNMPMC